MTACRMVSSVILNCPSQGRCLSVINAFSSGSCFFRRPHSHSHICLTSYRWSLISSIFSLVVSNMSSKLFPLMGLTDLSLVIQFDDHAINSPGIRIRCWSPYRIHLLEGADVLSLSLCRCSGDEYAVRYSWLPTPTSQWPSVHNVLELVS